jgi:signal transduction histidine kinase
MKKMVWIRHLSADDPVIRQRIYLALVHMLLLTIIWGTLAAFVYSADQAQTLQAVDHQLADISQNLSFSKQRLVEADDLHQPDDLHLVVWSRDHSIVAYYHPFPRQATTALRHTLLAHPSSHPDYFTVSIIGIPYRLRQWTMRGHLTVQLYDGIQDDQSRLNRLLTLLALGGVIGLVLSLVGGFIMGLWTLQPIVAARRHEQALLSTVAHELRTPLAAMSARVELLLQHGHDPIEAHLPWVETVYGETQRMIRLVNDLVSVGRLEQGKRALNIEPMSLNALCKTVDAIYRPVLEDAGLYLKQSIPTDATVMADPLRLRQLLLIFLDNAKKHTQHGGVELSVVVRGIHAELHIKDTGVGMTTKTKASSHPLSEPDSLGLGLVIARKICEAHGATLSFTSTPDRGTDVTVTFRRLPFEQPSP